PPVRASTRSSCSSSYGIAHLPVLIAGRDRIAAVGVCPGNLPVRVVNVVVAPVLPGDIAAVLDRCVFAAVRAHGLAIDLVDPSLPSGIRRRMDVAALRHSSL